MTAFFVSWGIAWNYPPNFMGSLFSSRNRTIAVVDQRPVYFIQSLLCIQIRKMCLNWNGVLTVIKVGSPLLYLVSRPVMVVEAFVGLRAMEPARHKIYELTIIVSYD